MQINEKRMRKLGPKKVCGIQRKRNQNGTQMWLKMWSEIETNRKKRKKQRHAKVRRNINAETRPALIDRSVPRNRFSAGRGRGGGWIQQDFNGSFTHPAPQAGCGGWKSMKNRPWGANVMIFVRFFAFWREANRSWLFEVAKITPNHKIRCKIYKTSKYANIYKIILVPFSIFSIKIKFPSSGKI